MNKLKALSLLLCAVLCMSCENPFLKCLLPENAPEVSAPAPAPVEKDVAVLTLSPDRPVIRVMVTTADGSSVTVKGCTEATLASGTETFLHAQGTRVTLKGKITELRCRNNKLTALDVQGLPLQELYCAENRLASLDVQGLPLQTLYCGGNQLTSLDVQGLSDLRYLACVRNQLKSLNAQGCAALQRLDCRDNQLTSLNVQGCSALQTLICERNQLKSLDVQGLPLQTLYCGGNQLTSLDVQGLSDLRYLSCGHNQLTSLDVRGCSALQGLDCYKNKLDAAAFISIFDALPDYSGQLYGALCTVYSTEPGEGNCTNFNSPPELQTAFNGAKTKNWKMYKKTGTEWQEI